MPDALETTEAALCIERIAAYQNEQHLSDVELVRRFPALGSSRTWRARLAPQNWAEAPVSVWLPKLQAVVAKIEGRNVPPAGAPLSLVIGTPLSLVIRHLGEAEACRRENNLPLARSHCRAARQAIEQFQRTLTP